MVTLIDALGLAAGVAVIAAFDARDPRRLRVVAVLSNLLFMAYALGLGLWPVLILHGILLPLNLARLAQLRASDADQSGSGSRPGPQAKYAPDLRPPGRILLPRRHRPLSAGPESPARRPSHRPQAARPVPSRD